VLKLLLTFLSNEISLQCFDIVNWVTGRASGLFRSLHHMSTNVPLGWILNKM